MTKDETINFIQWCAAQVLELAGIGPQAAWASDTARELRSIARSSRPTPEERSEPHEITKET